MEPNKGEESGEMYSPDEQGEYVPEADMLGFSVQGLPDALTALDTEVTAVQSPSKKFTLLLEVMMADCPGHPWPPAFSRSAGMVMYILKGDAAWRDLKHIQSGWPWHGLLVLLWQAGPQRTYFWCCLNPQDTCGRGICWVDLPPCTLYCHSPSTGRRLVLSSCSLRVAPTKVLCGVSRPPHDKSCYQWVRLHHRWVVSHLLQYAWVRWKNQEVAEPLRCQLLDQGEDP